MILSILEEDAPAVVYIELTNDVLTEEDCTEEDEGGLLHKKSGGNSRQSDFKEYVADVYLTRYGNRSQGQGRPRSNEVQKDKCFVDNIRYDDISHYLTETPGKKRRRCADDGCQKHPSSQCSKCNVGLCLSCNISYSK